MKMLIHRGIKYDVIFSNAILRSTSSDSSPQENLDQSTGRLTN